MPVDASFIAQSYDGKPISLTDAEGNPLPFPPTANGHPTIALGDRRYPQFRFEWHTLVRKLYVIDLNVALLQGEMVDDDIDDHARAFKQMWVWLRGYRAREQSENGRLIRGVLTE